MMCDLAFITGATSGIGEALCHLLALEGIPLFITGRNEEKLRAMAKELQVHTKVSWQVADLSDPLQCNLLASIIQQRTPDLLINNAGFGLYGDIECFETKEQMEILQVDGVALLQLTIEAAKALLKQKKKGTILNVASAAGFYTAPHFAIYTSVKAFVIHLSQTLDLELSPKGIRVLVSCPGMVATSFSKRAANSPESYVNTMSISAEQAAKEIWEQIKQGKGVHVFDWKTRWGGYLAKCFPRTWVGKIVGWSIKKRI